MIYKITNSVNNKVYIGLTTQGLIQRQREHLSRLNDCNRTHKLYQAMRKYGADKFKFEEIFVCFNDKDLVEFETAFIKEYNSFNKGYNMTVGGEVISQETKDKLRTKMLGRKLTWYNKILESRKNNPNDKRNKYHKLQTEAGEIIIIRNLKEFCVKHGIDVYNLYHAKKHKKFVKGYLLLESSTTSLMA